MDLASARRLRYAVAASLTVHAVIIAALPGVRLAVSHAAAAGPMRVTRVYQAAVIPPQLISAVIAAPIRARATPALAPRTAPRTPPAVQRLASRPNPALAGAEARPAASPPSPGPAAPLRVGSPEPLGIQPASGHPPATGLILSEPAPSRGEGGGGGGAASGGGGGSGPGAAGPGGTATAGGGSGSGQGTGATGPGEGASEPGRGAAAVEATVPPAALSIAKPPYPEECRRRGQEGTVRLRVLVARDGSVSRAEVARSSSVGAFDRAAVEGARQWRFTPARRGAATLDAWVALSVVFKLEDAGV